MSHPTSQSEDFCPDEYEQATGRTTELFSVLPPEAVQSVAEEVLSRLAARDRTPGPRHAARPSTDMIAELCRSLASADPNAAARIAQDALAAGATVEDLYLHYLAPAARMLGQWWTEDDLSFMQVTTTTARIFAILRALDGHDRSAVPRTCRAALFAAVPGETHTLGVRMAADLFRRKGWDITLELGLPHEALVDRITAARPVLIGLSAAGAHAAPALARLIVALRMTVPAPIIAVSGQIVHEAGDVVSATTPDALITDIDEAEVILARLWGEHISRLRNDPMSRD
ncbi:Methanogenic corrinoid protein MtbC1 [Rhodovulum sp. ES.010]|uniref:cobalamin B12-binding domain-containing protein n=1 Tax=Rhodovulum sp. ES.010 TaxID=1882821 RepID=UPI00092A07EB|nr:cobalamin-dependent protein [Rhodovulum sp. ES.010]SIO39004.1 Methanogenic corrinoid protein MtbC1 [Rhodovulum sp. ES.010]